MQILSWQTLLTIAHLYLVTGFKDMYNDQKYRLANDLEYISDDRYSPSKIKLYQHLQSFKKLSAIRKYRWLVKLTILLALDKGFRNGTYRNLKNQLS